MVTSETYAELVTKAYGRAQQDGCKPYPVAAYEIFMLAQAQQRATRKEVDLFCQLGEIFDWNMARRERNAYTKKLESGFTFILTDVAKTILWTSRNFLTMTGYSSVEAIGQTPRLLHGPDTDLTTVLRVREALRQTNTVKADLLNYRKNGDTYFCRLQIDPLFDRQGKLSHFLAVESEILV